MRRRNKPMNWLLEVTDLKQYTCCPRIVFYRYCLPKIRPLTYSMEEGIRSHLEEENREERRSLRNYGLVDGERFFHVMLQSEHLGLTGRVDLAIAVPSRGASNAEAAVVEYKDSERKAGPIPITPHLRRKVVQTVAQIRQRVESEIIPPPPTSLRRCVTCEFRRFCN